MSNRLESRLNPRTLMTTNVGIRGPMIFFGTYSATACASEAELSDVGRLRYDAYRDVDAIGAHESRSFLDTYDRCQNSKTLLVRQNGDPVAAIRASVYASELGFAPIPCMEVYKDDLVRYTGGLEGPVVESNRFVIHPRATDSARLFKLLFRFIILNALKYNADFVVTAVRARHMGFYKRLLMQPISEPKAYPGLNVDMVLLGGQCRRDLQRVIRQDPIYALTTDEIDAYAVCAPSRTSL